MFAISFTCTTQAAPDHSLPAALAAFKLASPDLLIEIAAAEPDVLDPVDVAWDEAGGMFVAEMRDYPNGPGTGTIRRLEDKDGDGRYESAVLYAEGIAFPSSVLPWRGGLFVTSAPDIIYLKDTNGDGRADERNVVLTGFALGDQQLRVNGLMFGLDGWVYAANGRLGGMIRRPGDPESAAVSIARSDLRFDPDTGEYEAVEGPSQFGLARDDWGNRFLSWNTIPIRHVAIEDRFANGAPGVAAVIPRDDSGRIYPIAALRRRHNRESAEFFNASCGTMIYRGDLIPALRGQVFVCESLASLVHRRTLEPAGATFVSNRADEGVEFLASSDSWFRPVNLESGPDGALYVVDLCREEIEHPDFIPEEFRKGMNFRAGDGLGRIWRIRPKAVGSQGSPAAPRSLAGLSVAELTEALNEANGWTRDTAQRVLIERADPACSQPILDVALQAVSPEARLAALWTLAALDRKSPRPEAWLTEAALRVALKDPDRRVGKGALQIYQSRPPVRGNWTEDLLRLADDPDPAVRLETALAARGLDGAKRIQILTRIASGAAADEWLSAAVVASAGETAGELAASLLEQSRRDGADAPESRDLLYALGKARGAGPDADRAAVEFASYCACDGVPPELQIALLSGFLAGLEAGEANPGETLARAAVRVRESGGDPAVDWFIRAAGEIADSRDAPDRDRARAVRVMALAPPASAESGLLKLLAPGEPPEVRIEAARAFGRIAGAEAGGRLKDQWGVLPLDVRRTLMTELARKAPGARALVEAADAGRLSKVELRGAAGEALTRHPDDGIRAAAAELFAAQSDRASVVAKYQPALTLAGDAGRGAELFARNCAACHRIQGLGAAVGPDLSGAASRTKEKLLSDILDPGSEIAPDFVNYIAVTAGGEIVAGLMVREGPQGVTLRQARETETSIAAGRLAEFRASEVSLMPEGFEEAMDPQAMADLLEFLHRGAPEAATDGERESTEAVPR